jgi:hypothetical protein
MPEEMMIGGSALRAAAQELDDRTGVILDGRN